MRDLVSIDIAAPAERVWTVLTEVERWPEWTGSVRRVERLDVGPLALGNTVRLVQPRLRPAMWRVTELTPPRSFNWSSTSGGVTTEGSHLITPVDGGGVRVELAIEHAGLLAPVVGWLTASLTRRYLRMEADGLKQRSEQG